MKNFRVSALLLVCVVALFGWLWGREREPALPPGVQIVARFTPNQIQHIVLKTVGQPTLQLQKNNSGEWQISEQVLAARKTGKTPVFADAKHVDEFLNAFAILRSDVILADAKKSEYGLGAPRVSVELNGQRIAFGAPAFFDNNRIYARVADKIVLLPRALAQAAARPLDAWRDHSLARLEIEKIQQVVLNNGQEKIVLVKTRETAIAPTIGGENWQMKVPYSEAADSEKIVALLQLLQAAQVQKFLEIGSENWGFAKPTSQISLNNDAPFLTVGRKTQNGYAAYGRMKNAPFVVGEDVVQTLRKPVDNWRSHRVMSFDLNEVTRVNLRARGQDLVYLRDGARWYRQGTTANAFDENALAINDILVAVRDWRASDFLYPSQGESDNGQTIFRLTLPELQGARDIKIWRAGKQWRARVTGEQQPPRPVYVLPESTMASLNALLDRLLAPVPTPAPAKIGPRI